MSAYSEYFLNTRLTVRQYELLEISHPDFTKTYRIVRNSDYAANITVDLSPTETGVEFEYYPLNIEPMGAHDDLDSSIRIDLGDVGEVLPDEVDAVARNGGFLTKPSVRYWAYRSDVLTDPIYGPLTLEIPSLSMNSEGSSFEAKAPVLNSNKTGERMTLDRFPMQRGFIG